MTRERTQTDARPGSQHTPGPWVIENDTSREWPDHRITIRQSPRIGADGITRSWALAYLRPQVMGTDETEANARRIVDCVNACDAHGLTDPDRDIGELKEALRRLLNCPELNWDETDEVSASAIKNAHALLARSNGARG